MVNKSFIESECVKRSTKNLNEILHSEVIMLKKEYVLIVLVSCITWYTCVPVNDIMHSQLFYH